MSAVVEGEWGKSAAWPREHPARRALHQDVCLGAGSKGGLGAEGGTRKETEVLGRDSALLGSR